MSSKTRQPASCAQRVNFDHLGAGCHAQGRHTTCTPQAPPVGVLRGKQAALGVRHVSHQVIQHAPRHSCMGAHSLQGWASCTPWHSRAAPELAEQIGRNGQVSGPVAGKLVFLSQAGLTGVLCIAGDLEGGQVGGDQLRVVVQHDRRGGNGRQEGSTLASKQSAGGGNASHNAAHQSEPCNMVVNGRCCASVIKAACDATPCRRCSLAGHVRQQHTSCQL